ncbi:hypothetical protein HOY82DRAFT_600273 [Tuber indicum]|nr:hypothetical protein HOY82DRAFT_600273 [Tuber indicum]
MPSNPHEDMSERSTPTDTSSSNNEESALQTPISSPNHSNAPPPTSDYADTCASRLACPVSSCQAVFRGEMAHRHFWRHLKNPEISSLEGGEEVIWLNLHKVEHERFLSALEEDKVEEERMSRTDEFKSRAKNMGITDESFVAEKVAIWEGMWAAEQTGNDIQYGAGILLDAATGAD